MSGTGVLSGNFSIFVANTDANPFTIGALGFQYEIVGFKVQTSAAVANPLIRQTSITGALITQNFTTPAGNTVSWIPLSATRGNMQIPATVPLYVDPIAATLLYLEIVCIGRANITPPTPFTGVEVLTIA